MGMSILSIYLSLFLFFYQINHAKTIYYMTSKTLIQENL